MQVTINLSAVAMAAASLTPVLLALMGWWTHRKLNKIEHLVNGQLAIAIARIGSLEKRLGIAPGQDVPDGAPGTNTGGMNA